MINVINTIFKQIEVKNFYDIIKLFSCLAIDYKYSLGFIKTYPPQFYTRLTDPLKIIPFFSHKSKSHIFWDIFFTGPLDF